jgi:proteasome lid subunit RPN8/RPN11
MSGVLHIPPGHDGIAASADFLFARAANVEYWVVR